MCQQFPYQFIYICTAFIHWSTDYFFCILIYIAMHTFYPSIYLSIYGCYLYIHIPIYAFDVSIYIYDFHVNPFIHLFINWLHTNWHSFSQLYQYIFLSMHPFNQPAYIFFYLYIDLCIYVFDLEAECIYKSIHLCIHLYIYSFIVVPSIYSFIHIVAV